MALRTSKSGANADGQFWGCTNYPRCRTTLPINQEAGNKHASGFGLATYFVRGTLLVTMSVTKLSAPDLTQRPPRSPRTRLGGFVLLPRMLDKGRATLAGKNGEYHYNCPLDQHLLNFIGIDPKKLLAVLKKGQGDGEVLAWIQANAKHQRTAWEIQQWSDYHDRRGPDSDAETLAFFSNYVSKLTKTREDIKTWADLLDLDDYVTFGGKV